MWSLWDTETQNLTLSCPYNGQVECMNQAIIHMIGKLEDKKACWSQQLPELLMAYNATSSAVTG